MAASKIAQFREYQHLQEQSAIMGLQGFTVTARHDFIVARAQQGADHILKLIEEGKDEEAHDLWNTDTWGIGVDENDEKTVYDS